MDENHLLATIRYVEMKILKRHEHTGRPLGRDSFVAELEKTLGRVLCSQKENSRLRILSPELPVLKK
jgi:hypothetical protein